MWIIESPTGKTIKNHQKLQSCGDCQQKTQNIVVENFFKKSLKKYKKIVDIKF